MKHLYWIICSVLTLGLLTAWLFIVPTEEAKKSKESLDSKSKVLKDLEAKAVAGSPTGEINAENADETKRLSTNYLITEKWKPVLEQHISAYHAQLKAIKTQLLSRSLYLRKPISADLSQSSWYTAYVAECRSLISELRKAGLLSAKKEDAKETEGPYGAKLENGEAPHRTTLGLEYTPARLPNKDAYPGLTAHLRILQLLAARLISVKGEVTANPFVEMPASSNAQATGLSILSVRFPETITGDQITKPITTVVSTQLTTMATNVNIRLKGSLSVLLAAANAIECNTQTDGPLVVISSAKLERHENATVNDYLDVPTELAELELELSVIEFADPDAKPSTGVTP